MDYPARTPEQLGKILKGFRKNAGMTQQEAGSLVGLLQKSVSLLETKPENVPIRQLFKMLSALGLEIAIRPKQNNATTN
ncbi:XRE family transcriptional regulator [Permianibacter aggregans]|uniref:HTH-type transcriptional regulator/antitoxin HipB n=1 Tax=Permianibacter aggregans TaxID=1510150 RepID=A0A4V6PWR8_9GAMM|nr:XRE family transcriptional regulator [Permianibacter aggregans]QGX40157.1 XRE family transcriptional regulator [Permianibacter aggregans]TDQ49027.1 HTH-type transcriptional regulator/antitoxin HipB [Permianibacter aggregans]